MAAKQDTVRIFQRVTGIIWQRLSPTFGIRTINAIAKNAIARRTKTFPYLTNLKVSDDGLEWREFEAGLDKVDEEEVASMLEELMDEFYDALSVMIGRLIVGRIFQKVEQEIKKGEAE